MIGHFGQWKQHLPNRLELTNASIAFVDEDQSRWSENKPEAAVSVVVRKAYNPNGDKSWFTSIVAIINQVTMLTPLVRRSGR